ncbi:hypothetical protein [Streptomyces sp. NPDC005423]|uniref:hypothetical protein n=1 Tax=Streptomyces sp. NPDC005423 TaxID=3155343 RepID=UPI0033B93CD5
MRSLRIRAPKQRWHALLAAVLLGAIGLIGAMMLREWQQAELLDETGIRVTGVVSRVVLSTGKGEPVRGEIVYTVAGRRHTVRKAPNGGYPPPRKGDRVCLEAARERPRLVRLCGDRYPDGDDGFPTLVLVAVAATIGLLVVAGHWINTRRELLTASARTTS